MTKEQFAKYFSLLFVEHPKPTADVEATWFALFKDVCEKYLIEAIKLFLKKQTYGRPRIADLWECVERVEREYLPKIFTISAEEAYLNKHKKSELIDDTIAFTNTLVPPDWEHQQFSTPEELQKAEQIHKATWKREFLKRFSEKQKQCLDLYKKGLDPRQALPYAQPKIALPPDLKLVVDNTTKKLSSG